MSHTIGKPLNTFNNNKPHLTSSERIRNKRDATIYQAEKQRFQKKRCGDKNIKYYANGTIRNMSSYKLQNSLARGNVLCEDCNDEGLLCNGPSKKSQLSKLKMGDNTATEFWGGGTQKKGNPYNVNCFPVINVIDDLSGVDLRSFNQTDPSNVLFSNNLCDPFRYLKHTNMKTYIVITANIFDVVATTNLTCVGWETFDSDYKNSNLISHMVNIGDTEEEISGIIESICCMGPGIFDIYVELFYIKNYAKLGSILKGTPFPAVKIDAGITYQILDITKMKIFQGAIQTKHNATEQSYMSCLEDGTQKINFTKQKSKEPIISGACGDTVYIPCGGLFVGQVIKPYPCRPYTP